VVPVERFDYGGGRRLLCRDLEQVLQSQFLFFLRTYLCQIASTTQTASLSN